MDSDFTGPVNVGSEEMVTINRLADLIMDVADKKLTVKHIAGPLGVRGRNSDNRMIQERLGSGVTGSRCARASQKTYRWIANEVERAGTNVAGAIAA